MISNKLDQLKQITAIFSAFTIGFTSMIGQLVLMREMIIVFYGNELSIGVILSAWLFWVALGSSVLGRITDRIRWRLNALLGCQFLTFFILPLSIFAARNIRNIIGVSPGELIGFRPILISAFLVLMPICVLIGFAFSLTCRILADVKSQSAVSIGQVYIFEAVGASVGGLLANFVLIEFLNPYQIVFLVGTLSILCAIKINLDVRDERPRLALTAMIVGSLAIIVAGWTFSSRLHEFSSRRQWSPLNLEHTENSVYGNIAVTKMDDQYSFYENGLLMFTTKDQLSSEESVHFALLEHPNPKNVLLIGGGVGGSLEQILKHPVEHVDYVELDPMIIDVAKKYLSEAEQKPLFDERVQIHHIDARRFIKTSYDKQESQARNPDLVIVNLPEPFTALLNRFYSLEFFNEVEEILADRGVLALSMISSENYLNQEQKEIMRSFYATLNEVFDDVKVLPGGRNYFIAQKLDNSKDPDTTYDASVLVDRLKERQLDTMYVHEYYLPYRLSPDRVDQVKSALSAKTHVLGPERSNVIPSLHSGQARVVEGSPSSEAKDLFSHSRRLNHDFRPIGYFYDMQLWGTQFSQQSFGVKFTRAISKLNFWHVFIGIVVLFAFVLVIQFKWKRTIRFPVILSIGTTGFSEMLFQVVVILSFQVLYGYVYHKLSLILAAFMIGLVGGSWLINRTMDRLKNPVRTYILTQVSICIYPLILLSILLMAKTSVILHLATPFALLPIIAGFIGGVQFPLANKIVLEEKAKTNFSHSAAGERSNKQSNQTSTVPLGEIFRSVQEGEGEKTKIEFSHSAVGGLAGLIYGIDLLGSCAGALLASAILVPILGVFQTCLLVTLLNAMVLVSILLARRGEDSTKHAI